MIMITVSKRNVVMSIDTVEVDTDCQELAPLTNKQAHQFHPTKAKKVDGQTFQLNGLNETAIFTLINKIRRGEATRDEMYKGTRFHGHTLNVFGFYARLLKEGLPAGVEVPSNVKWKWDAHDLLQYISHIQRRVGKTP